MSREPVCARGILAPMGAAGQSEWREWIVRVIQSRLMVSWLAVLAAASLVTACGSASGNSPSSSSSGATSTGGTAAAGGCAAGAVGSGTALTVAQEPDADVSTPAGKCWASIKGTAIAIPAIPTVPSADSTTFQVAWSAKGLYIMSTDLEWPLSDAGGANWWQDDTTEFVVSGSDDHGGTFDTQTFQFGIDNGGTLQAGTDAANASPQPTATVRINQGKGFNAELFVPWSTLMVKSPAKGQKYQFDIAEDYSDSSGNRDAQAVWAGDSNFYNTTTNWGDITLG